MLPPTMDAKRRAAESALEMVQSDMCVGLGTGSTADFFLIGLSQAIHSGKLRNIRGVPTSKRSKQRAIELKIPLTTLSQCSKCDITVDGADEIAPNLDLIKGLGGALLREKIVAQNSKKLVIIADSGKTVPVLGAKGPLPVEVTIFGHETHREFLRSLGCVPTLRLDSDGSTFVTDNGNYIYDCKFDKISDPHGLEKSLNLRAGIVESGLFLDLTTIALIGSETEVKKLTRLANPA